MNHAWVIFLKSARQQGRDRIGLALTLMTAPFFVIFYWLIFSSADLAHPVALSCAPEIEDAVCREVRRELTEVLDHERAERALEVRELPFASPDIRTTSAPEVALQISIDEGYLLDPARVTLIGDASSSDYRMAMPHVQRALSKALVSQRRGAPLVVFEEQTLGRSGARTRFEAYVPSLLVFAVIMLVFSSSMAVAKEVEGRTFERLILTGMRPRHYLAGVSAMQALLGVGTVSLTLGVALLLGFESRGSLLLAMAIASLAGVACVGVGMIAASLARTVAQAFLVASSFMFLLMLFSGLVFPLPRLTLFEVAGRGLGPFDLLPTVHASRAMGRVLTLGAGGQEITFELLAMTLSSGVCFLLGWWMFKGRHTANSQQGRAR